MVVDRSGRVIEQRAHDLVANWLTNRVPTTETRSAGPVERQSAYATLEAAQADQQLYQALLEQAERWLEAVTTWEIARQGYRGSAKGAAFLTALVAYIEQVDAELSRTVAAIHELTQQE